MNAGTTTVRPPASDFGTSTVIRPATRYSRRVTFTAGVAPSS